MDLPGGGFPQYDPAYLLNGRQASPVRESVDRRSLNTSALSIASNTMTVIAVPCQPGDVIGAVSLAVKTATATPAHSWVALYTGVTAADTLIAQSPDAVGGFTAGALKLALAKAYSVGGVGGTPQGSVYTGGPAGPAVLGVAIYASGGATVFDGVSGGSAVAGEVVVPGQVPLVSTLTVAASATAPASLAGIAAAAAGLPYVALTRS